MLFRHVLELSAGPLRLFAILLLAGGLLSPTASGSQVTAADLVGPDGIVYPNFAWAGRLDDIPDIPVVARATDFGAVADDDGDDAAAIQKALDHVAAQGRPGAVLLGPGTFMIDHTVMIKADGVVLRGSGPKQTILIPRFDGQGLGKQGGAPRTPTIYIEGQLHPRRAQGWLAAPAQRGDTIIEVEDASRLIIGEGLLIGTMKIAPEHEAMLSKQLRELYQRSYDDARTRNYLSAKGPLNFGIITAIEGNRVTLDRPLRGDFPIERESFFDMQHRFVQDAAIEDLGITQPDASKTQIDGIRLKRAYGCWVRNVFVGPIGSWPLSIDRSANNVVISSTFDDVHARGGGGVAYFGISSAFDNLIDDCSISRVRHVSIQQHATGNVFRRTRIHNADLNFHFGWPAETLFDACDVNAGTEPGELSRGSAGTGFYTPSFHGNIHLPSGPRHVVYHSTIRSPEESITLGGGGSSHNIFAHSLFVADERVAVILRRGSDHNLFVNNTFVLRDYDKLPADWDLRRMTGEFEHYEGLEERFDYVPGAVLFLSGPAIGNRFLNNRFLGVPEERGFVGVSQDVERSDNTYAEKVPGVLPEAPRAPAPSLLQWQRDQTPGGS